MKLHHSLLPLFLAAQLPACAPAPSRAAAETAPIAQGETVAEISKSCWIVFQDQAGNHWFGSDGQGVCRYDGRTITRFTTRDGLSNDHVRGIQQHASGDLLITTNGGVSKFDGRQFVTLPVHEVENSDAGWRLDPDDVWLPLQGGQRGPYRYDGKTLHHLRFPKSPLEDEYFKEYPNLPWSPYEIYCVYRDSRGHMWFGTSNFGICRYDGETREWMYEKHLTEIGGGRMFGIRSIIEDRSGAFWFCNTQFRFRIAPSTAAVPGNGQIIYEREPGIDLSDSAAGEDSFYFQSVTKDEDGDLWMATYGGGVWRYDGKTATHFPVRAGAEDVTVNSIYTDRRGDLWLGTHEAGPFRFNGNAFEQFKP